MDRLPALAARPVYSVALDNHCGSWGLDDLNEQIDRVPFGGQAAGWGVAGRKEGGISSVLLD